jgi:hypothetical protein
MTDLAADAATGAIQQLEPNPLHVKLVPLPQDQPPMAAAPLNALRAMPSIKVVQRRSTGAMY